MKIENRGFKFGPRLIHNFSELKVSFGMRLFLLVMLVSVLGVFSYIYAVGALTASPFLFGKFSQEDNDELKTLLKGVANENKESVKTEVQAALAGVVKMADLEAKFEALGLKADVIKTLTDAVTKQGDELKAYFDKINKHANANKSFEEIIDEKKDAIAKTATGGEVVTLKFSNQHRMRDALKTLVQRSAMASSTMGMMLSEMGQVPYLDSVISGCFRHVQMAPNAGGTIRYIDQVAPTRGAAAVAEAGTKPESVMSWIERSAVVEKIADSIPVTKEALNDIGFIQGEIDRLLNLNLTLKEDEYFYSGSGVTPIIKGIYTYTSAAVLAASSYASIVQDANIYDLIAVLRVYISNSKQSKYMPNKVLMNPIDILRYKLAKAVDGHYILPPFIAANGQVIDGVQVVESSQVTANTLLVGDFRYGTVYDLEGVTVEVGHINDQFVKNTKTILAEKRTMLLVRNVDLDAFAKVTDITAALDIITKL